jgi:hypothetical protein
MSTQASKSTMNIPLVAATLSLLALAAPRALADSPLMPLRVPAAYSHECGACHTAYPPALLPARSWQRLMSGLGQHYGSDATLDPKTLADLSGWLQQHAGTARRVAEEPPQDRITRSAWFERQHRKVDPAVCKLPSVKSAAQCAACHGGAGQGRFGDDELITPAGLSQRQRRAWAD